MAVIGNRSNLYCCSPADFRNPKDPLFAFPSISVCCYKFDSTEKITQAYFLNSFGAKIMSNLKVKAYANFELKGPKKEHSFELGPLPDDFVDVKVTHSGIA